MHYALTHDFQTVLKTFTLHNIRIERGKGCKQLPNCLDYHILSLTLLRGTIVLMAKQGQKLLRVGAAAHELGLHPMTVRRWIKAGRIGAVQVGREVRVPRSEIERIVGSID